jgi:hypothetical protein
VLHKRHQIRGFDLEKELLASYNALDNAYYNTGTRHPRSAIFSAGQLAMSEFGRKFILTPDEMLEFLKK